MMGFSDNCKGCGKCCIFRQFKNIDEKLISTKVNDKPFYFLRGRCMYLNDKNECSIYENRPEFCKLIIPGDDTCLSVIKSFET
jgi:Fe-S-cluster containining protein